MLSSTRRRREGPPVSKRWSTTTQSALEETAEQLYDIDRSSMAQAMKERKTINSKTSISFGREKINYISDAMENQQMILRGQSAEERLEQSRRIKAMKAELTQTSFKLGDETPIYETVNQESMRTTEKLKTEKVQMNTDLKEAVKKSSIHFGNENVPYKSAAHEAMEFKGNTNDFSSLKKEVTELKTQLRKHNFTLGDEKVEYISDSHRGYGSMDSNHYRRGDRKAEMRSLINEARSAHFSLGGEKIEYISDAHRAMAKIEGHESNDIRAQAEHARKMKQALQKTSICIGDDNEYM